MIRALYGVVLCFAIAIVLVLAFVGGIYTIGGPAAFDEPGHLTPLTPAETRFTTFAMAYANAYDDYRLRAFENGVKGEPVSWEGRTAGISCYGDSFDLHPVVGPKHQNGSTRCPAFIYTKGELVPEGIKPFGQRVRVTGHVSGVTALGVRITATKVEVLE